jgi:hypothetical protein
MGMTKIKKRLQKSRFTTSPFSSGFYFRNHFDEVRITTSIFEFFTVSQLAVLDSNLTFMYKVLKKILF